MFMANSFVCKARVQRVAIKLDQLQRQAQACRFNAHNLDNKTDNPGNGMESFGSNWKRQSLIPAQRLPPPVRTRLSLAFSTKLLAKSLFQDWREKGCSAPDSSRLTARCGASIPRCRRGARLFKPPGKRYSS